MKTLNSTLTNEAICKAQCWKYGTVLKNKAGHKIYIIKVAAEYVMCCINIQGCQSGIDLREDDWVECYPEKHDLHGYGMQKRFKEAFTKQYKETGMQLSFTVWFETECTSKHICRAA